VQKYGFWFLVRAWAKDYTSWMIHYGFLSYWAEIEDLLFMRQYPRIGGGPGLRIWRAGIDTGGGKYEEELSSAEHVYLWLIENRIGHGCQVWGTKGSSKPLAGKISVGKSLQHTPSGRTLPGGLQIISLDTNKLKDMVHFRMDKAISGAAEMAQMAAYLHADTQTDYAKQIMSEVKKRDKKGRETWVREYRENHLLDCEVIAHSLADPEWPGGGVHLLSEPAAEVSPPRKATPPPDPRERAAAARERLRNIRR
jgi:phage terminase large subunit GpA-like protein